MWITLAACGGGGGGAPPPVPSAALSTLTADRATAPADGTTAVLLVATVRDTAGAPLGGSAVAFETTGSAAQLQPSAPQADGGGVATALLTATVPGAVTVRVVVEPAGAAVPLQQTVTVQFAPLVAPVVAGPARFEDADRDGAASPGDRVVVPFSRDLVVDGAGPGDFVLPVAGDTFGAAASVVAGPAAHEVTIVLGAAPRLRTRGRFAPTAVTENAPSGLLALATPHLRSAVDGTPVAGAAAVDVGPAPVALPGRLPAGALLVGLGQLSRDDRGDVLAVYGDVLQPWFGDGAGGFAPGPILGVTEIRAVVTADLNGVPADEALTAHAFGVQIWNNEPIVAGGSELVAGGIVAAGDTWSVLVTDLDGDWFPDVVAGTASGVVVARHQRDAQNGYAIVQAVGIGGPVTALAAGDLDGDGDADVLAAMPGNDAVAILWNDGGGLVAGPVLALVGARAVAVGDVDGDGRADVVATGTLATRRFRNTATGFVGDDVGDPALDVALVDVDRDAFPDLLLRFGDRVAVRLADRSGGFGAFATFAAGAPVAFAHGDLDGDADVDFAVAAADGTRVFAGSSTGTFGATALQLGPELGAAWGTAQVLGDVDGDGVLDRLAATATGIERWLGDGAGGFVAAGSFGQGGAAALALADLDGDSDLDLVVGRDGEDEVWANDGAGGFALALSFAAGTATRALAVGDYDGDGDADIVLGNDGDNRIFLNDSAGGVLQFAQDPSGFVLLPIEQIERDTLALAMWDCDRDGDLDLFVLNCGTPSAPQDGLLLENTNLGYVLRQSIQSPLPPTALALGDVDGDGRPDVVIARASADGTQALHLHRAHPEVAEPNGLAKLPVAIAAPGARAATGVALADFDADGRCDVALADGRSARPVLLLRQLADGTFAVAQTLAVGAAGLHAADLDRDGDVDLVTFDVDGPSRVLPNR